MSAYEAALALIRRIDIAATRKAAGIPLSIVEWEANQRAVKRYEWERERERGSNDWESTHESHHR